MAGQQHPEIGVLLNEVITETLTARSDVDRDFGAALYRQTALGTDAATNHQLWNIEDVIAGFVKPLADDVLCTTLQTNPGVALTIGEQARSVLLLVLDGMSAAAAVIVIGDAVQNEWEELTYAGPGRSACCPAWLILNEHQPTHIFSSLQACTQQK